MLPETLSVPPTFSGLFSLARWAAELHVLRSPARAALDFRDGQTRIESGFPDYSPHPRSQRKIEVNGILIRDASEHGAGVVDDIDPIADELGADCGAAGHGC